MFQADAMAACRKTMSVTVDRKLLCFVEFPADHEFPIRNSPHQLRELVTFDEACGHVFGLVPVTDRSAGNIQHRECILLGWPVAGDFARAIPPRIVRLTTPPAVAPPRE